MINCYFSILPSARLRLSHSFLWSSQTSLHIHACRDVQAALSQGFGFRRCGWLFDSQPGCQAWPCQSPSHCIFTSSAISVRGKKGWGWWSGKKSRLGDVIQPDNFECCTLLWRPFNLDSSLLHLYLKHENMKYKLIYKTTEIQGNSKNVITRGSQVILKLHFPGHKSVQFCVNYCG